MNRADTDQSINNIIYIYRCYFEFYKYLIMEVIFQCANHYCIIITLLLILLTNPYNFLFLNFPLFYLKKLSVLSLLCYAFLVTFLNFGISFFS